MMRKLLYSFLFFIFSKSSSKRAFITNLGLCFGMFFMISNSYAQCPFPTGATQAGSENTFCVDNPNTITFSTGSIRSGNFVLLNVIRGFTYNFSGNLFSGNEDITIFNASTNAYVGAGGYATAGSTNFTWQSTLSGQVKILLNKNSCNNDNTTSNNPFVITLNSLGNTQETQNEFGTNTWVGHIYNSTGSSPEPFSLANYAGYYDVPTESFSEGFGGDQVCFPVYSNSVQRASIYTEGFAVRYKMRTTKSGCYMLTITGDDGIRLSLNGTQVFDRWIQQSSTAYSNVVVNLTGNDNFVLDYYENAGGNVVGFTMVPFDPNSNTITAPSQVNFCSGGDPAIINGSLQYNSGDASAQNPQLNFQWQLSTDGGAFANIAGATTRNYDPPALTNGTAVNIVRRYKRLVTFTSAMANVNNVKTSCPYAESNIVTITTSPGAPVFPAGNISGTATQCPSLTGQVYSVAAAPNALSYTWVVPTGWSITAGQGTTSITVTTGNAGQNGNITVTAINGCTSGASSTKTLAVSVVASPNITSQPSTTGQSVCINAAATPLSVTAAAGSGSINRYTWYRNTVNSTTGGTNVGDYLTSLTTHSYTPSTTTAGTFYYYVVVTNTNNCTVTSAVSGALTVNPVHTISAGADRIVCQNSAMTAITMTLGGGATGATVTNLPPGVTYSVIGNVLTISGTPTAIDIFTYSVTTTGNSCTVATTGGTIRVGIGNNVLTYINGTSGSVCAGENENNPVSFTAPAGTYFNTVTFASYGLPSGGCGTYAAGYTCHSLTSQSVTETNLLGRSNTVTFTADNATFGDPCYGTGKIYRGSASFSQPVCEGSDAGTITGSPPTGPGGYTYQWERSTTGASGSFTAIASSNVQSYSPGIITQSTYYRRIVTSNGCTSTSPVIFIRVNARPTSNVTGSTVICNGQSATVSVALTGTGPWSLTRSNGSTSTNITNITASPYTFNVSPTSNTNYTVTAVSDANCSAIAADMTGTATITVNQIQATPSVASFANIDCVNSTGTITLGNLPSGSWQINQTGQATATINNSGTSYTITGLAAGSYTFTVQTATTCVSSSVSQSINDTSTSTWDGTTWVGGAPTSTKRIIIASSNGTPFPAGTPLVYGCSLTVNTGASAIVESGVTLVITNGVSTPDRQLTFRSGSSLIQTTATATNTGQINYERTTSVRRYDLTYWSMPVTNASFRMNTLSPQTLLDKYYTFNPNSTWEVNLNGTLPMEVGQGYSIRAPQPYDINLAAPFTGIFYGIPNNGNISPTVIPDRYNLVGNPYPSAISAAALIQGNTNLGTLYFWTHNTTPLYNPTDGRSYYNNTDFATFNLSGSTGVSAGARLNGQLFEGYIAAGQGFLALPKTSTLNFTNGMRVSNNNSQFYKTNNSGNSGEIERNRVWLNLSNDYGAFKQVLVGYIEGATNSFDINYDANTLGSNSSADFYSINGSDYLTIQGRALPFDNKEIIPLGYKVATAGEYTIGIDHADGFFDTQEVYLEDLVTAKTVNLRTENYKFTSAIGTFTNRFNLRYTSKTLGTGEFEDLENSVVVSLKNKVLRITSSKETIKDVNIYNIGGQILYAKTNINSSELQISNLNSSDQVLLVKITLENGHTLTKKVVYSKL